MKKNSLIQIIICTVLLTSLLSCNRDGKNAAGSENMEIIPEDIVEMRADQVEMAGVQLGSIEYRTLKSNLKVSGIVTVAPQNMATVCMPMGGFVESTTLIPGDAVHKGQMLAVLESQDYLDLQQDYLEARNKLEFAKADYERHSELYKEDVYSQKNLQQVTAEYKSLKAQARALEQKLELAGINPANLHEENITRSLEVTAPISGYIKSVGINVGKYVNLTDILFEIVNSESLMLELTLFEKDADKVKDGQEIRFFINNETEAHNAVVIQTGKAINEDKSYKVYANVIGKCENVLPGMYVNAVIETSGDEVACVPSESVVTFDDRDYIFIFDKEKEENGQPFTEYRMLEIEKGISDEGYIQLILPMGIDLKTARVVVKGAYNLLAAKKNSGEMAC